MTTPELAIPADAFEHGDPRRYRRGCRCTPCIRAASKESAKNQFLRATGRGTQRTPDRAADHIMRLRAAQLNDGDIRREAAICPDVLYRIMRREGTIHVATEQRILAVPVPQPDGPTRSHAYIPALGTHRRLRTLVAAGWYAAHLARRLGKDKQYVVYLIKGHGGGRVAMRIAHQVRDLYAELHDQRPEDHGLTPYLAGRARAQAAAQDWPGPDYWDEDDFDNPDFIPATTDTPRCVRLAEDGTELEAQGYRREDAAARLGVSRDYLDQSIKRWRIAQAKAAAEAEAEAAA